MRRFLIAAAVLGLFQACGLENFKAVRDVEESVAHVPRAKLVVTSKNGALSVRGEPQAKEVKVTARLRCGGHTQAEADERIKKAKLKVTRNQDDKTLRVEAVFPKPRRNNDGANITVVIPGASGIVARTANGPIRVEGLGGKLEVDTSNGSVSVSGFRGRVDARTTNGPITAREIGGPVHATTSNGNVTIELAKDQAGPVEAVSSNGSVTVLVGPAFAGAVRLATSNGRVNVNDLANRVTSRNLSKTSGSVQVGQGGEDSSALTSNGNVKFTIAR